MNGRIHQRPGARILFLGLTAGLLGIGGFRTIQPVRAQSAGAAQDASTRENAFWQLWNRQLASPEAHEELASAWGTLSRTGPADDPLSPAARTLEAWHLLRSGRIAEAREGLLLCEKSSSSAGTAPGAREIARAWLTCLDREALVAALEAYRTHHVRYPETLADLEPWPLPRSVTRPLFQDRWGVPWVYRLEALRSMPHLPAQRYSLRSRALADLSDLSTALSLRYAERITLRPVQVRAMTQGPPMITLVDEEPGAVPMTLQAGSTRGGFTVEYASPSLILLRDRFHWRAFPNPTRGAP